jgi:hypothetical protein
MVDVVRSDVLFLPMSSISTSARPFMEKVSRPSRSRAINKHLLGLVRPKVRAKEHLDHWANNDVHVGL